MSHLDWHSHLKNFIIKLSSKAIYEHSHFVFILIGIGFVSKHSRIWRDVQCWIIPVLHILNFFDCKVIWKVLLL